MVFYGIDREKKESNKRSEKKNSHRFSINTTKKKGLKIENYIYKIGKSKNNFFMEAIKEKIERDTGKSFEEFLQEKEANNNQLDELFSSGNDISVEEN